MLVAVAPFSSERCLLARVANQLRVTWTRLKIERRKDFLKIFWENINTYIDRILDYSEPVFLGLHH